MIINLNERRAAPPPPESKVGRHVRDRSYSKTQETGLVVANLSVSVISSFPPLLSLKENMPRATSSRFSQHFEPVSAKSKGKGKATQSSGTGTSNPLFNTERFGQHILKNPLVAQR
jgi:hypothetical protein